MKTMRDITEIELIPIRASKGLTFFASFVLDRKYFIGNVAVYSKLDKPGEFRLVYPTKTLKNGRQIPVFYPIDHKVSDVIEQAISEKAMELLSPDDNLINEIDRPEGGDSNG